MTGRVRVLIGIGVLASAATIAEVAAAQPVAQPAAAPSAACPANARDLPADALYGRWDARFDRDAGVATLRLAKHPDYAGVKGTVSRAANAPSAQIAGDIDDEGVLSLDESQDGQTISGVWALQLLPDTCGKEFKGTWRNAADDSIRDVVLRKNADRP